MTTSNQWLKAMLFLSAVVSVAVTMKLAVPLMVNFAVYHLPATWSIVISWLKPPYVYLLVNGIIITIAASTRLNQKQPNNQSQHLVNPRNTDLSSELPLETTSAVVYEIKPVVMVEPPPVVYETIKLGDSVVATSETSEIKSPKFSYPTVTEKQILTSRFRGNKKPTSSQGSRALKPKKYETMDSTWKMITNGRSKPLSRHSVNIQQTSTTNDFKKVMKKSETFSNYENENQYQQPVVVVSGGKDNSLSHDDLNNRVEAFIKKFNDDIKLQRQHSLNQFRDMLKPALQ